MSPLLLIVNRSIAHSEASRQSNAGNLTPAVRISGPTMQGTEADLSPANELGGQCTDYHSDRRPT